MTEEDFINATEVFFKQRGFITERIPRSKTRKRPDFLISRVPRRLSYIGELKSPELHLNEQTSLYMWLTSIRKIREFVQKAVAQFKSEDSYHDKPHILIFTSSHSQLNYNNLLQSLHGYVLNSDGSIMNDFRNDRVIVKSNPDIRKIDLYIWLQVGSDGLAHRASYVANVQSEYYEEVRQIILELKNTQAGSMNLDNQFEV